MLLAVRIVIEQKGRNDKQYQIALAQPCPPLKPRTLKPVARRHRHTGRIASPANSSSTSLSSTESGASSDASP